MAVFVPYLTKFDYLPSIQQEQLFDQILDSLETGDKQRVFAESWSMGVIRSFVDQKYDLNYEFTNTLPYDPSISYCANQRVILTYDSWVSLSVYQINSCIIYGGYAFCCIEPNQDETFDSNKWIKLGKENQIFYCKFPFDLFSRDIEGTYGTKTTGYYNIGDKVYLNNHTYECLLATSLTSHANAIQYDTQLAANPKNVFPDDKTSGSLYWKDLGLYVVIAGSLGDSELDFWANGDNRDPVMVQAVVDLSLWRLHSRISPQNIPELRKNNYETTLDWLRHIQVGSQVLNIEDKQPSQGNSLRWGSAVKKKNGY